MDKNILSLIADNQVLFDELKKVLTSKFTLDVSLGMDNEAMGEVCRAQLSGLANLNEGFKEIENLKTLPDTPEVPNPAR